MGEIKLSCSFSQGPRGNLEDDFGAFRLTCPLPNGFDITLAVVVDGVGGENYGEIVSKFAVNNIKAYIAASFADASPHNDPSTLSERIKLVLNGAFTNANSAILQQVNENPLLKGMSTTAVCALLYNNTLYVAWAGDSRCYLYRKEKLEQLTTDHSEVQKLIDAGLITCKEAKSHPLAHTINSFLGMKEGLVIGTRVCSLLTDDVVILCTDGLSDVVSDETITDFVWKYRKGKLSFDQLPVLLVKQAIIQQTSDNVTVMCCDYQSDSKFEPLGAISTGGYPEEIAKTLNYFNKESSHGL